MHSKKHMAENINGHTGNETTWINHKLQDKVSLVFEKRYGRKLSSSEIVEIALNLTLYMEVVFKGGGFSE